MPRRRRAHQGGRDVEANQPRIAKCAITLGALMLTGAALAQHENPRHRHRRHRRRLLPARRRARQHPLEEPARLPGDRWRSPAARSTISNSSARARANSAFVMADAALDALKGEDKFRGAKVAVRTLMILYPNRMHVVTVEGMGIEKMSDLKGKRVSTGSPGSATEVMAFRVIEAAGLDKDKGHAARAPRRRRVGERASRTRRSTPSSGSAACRRRR